MQESNLETEEEKGQRQEEVTQDDKGVCKEELGQNR